MKRSRTEVRIGACLLAALLACASDGNAKETASSAGPSSAAPAKLPSAPDASVDELVAPVALYPDPLLAIVLPASTYPLDVVQADRFLDRLAKDKTLQPDPAWHELQELEMRLSAYMKGIADPGAP